MRRVIGFFVGVSAFLRKEIVEIVRQPRLILTLVLSPFLILLLFGIGFRNESRVYRTLFVASSDSDIREQIDTYATSLGPQLQFAGVVENEALARSRLRRGQVDAVVVTPDHVYDKLDRGERPMFIIYHNEIDPLQDSYIRYVGRTYIEEVNRRVLQTITEEGQQQAAAGEQEISTIRTSTQEVRSALEQGDGATLEQKLQELKRAADSWAIVAGSTVLVASAIDAGAGTDVASRQERLVADVQESIDALNELQVGSDGVAADRIAEFAQELERVESALQEFQEIDPGILVSPFGAETRHISGLQLSFVAFYAPAVIALLLQHLSASFAALSIVREKWIGTIELFKVAPLTPFELLLGKFLSYSIFSGLIGAILTAGAVYLLDVPMVGRWPAYTVALIALISASTGMGFIISLLAKEISQAVQFTMILLLASVFFAGFFQDLDLFWAPIRALSMALPATYGIRLLQNVMLRGRLFPELWLFVLLGMSVASLIIAWLMLRRRMMAD